MDNEKKYALLIDADNISPKYIEVVMKETVALGVATFRRIYGDWTDVSKESWKKVLLDNSLTPVQQFSYTYGKNASDSAMIIDAMDILYTGDVDGFILVTSDSDFTRLTLRLREAGKQVIGMGESKTPSPFVKACEQFRTLDVLCKGEKGGGQKAAGGKKDNQSAAKKAVVENKDKKQQDKGGKKKTEDGKKQQDTQPSKGSDMVSSTENLSRQENASLSEGGQAETQQRVEEKATPITSLDKIKALVWEILDENSDDDGWVFLGDIGNMLIKSYPDFDARNYGYKKVKELFEAQPEFEVRSIMSSNRRTRLVYVRSKEKAANL